MRPVVGGQHFRHPVLLAPDTDDLLRRLRTAGLQILATTVTGGDLSLDDADAVLSTPTAWLFGQESRGLPGDVAARRPTAASPFPCRVAQRASTSRSLRESVFTRVPRSPPHRQRSTEVVEIVRLSPWTSNRSGIDAPPTGPVPVVAQHEPEPGSCRADPSGPPGPAG